MKDNICIKDETAKGSLICKDLCNELMQYQASKAKTVFYKLFLSGMKYENRLKPSFESAEDKQLLVTYDGDAPVGYVFSSVETVTEEKKNQRPPFANKKMKGFYPDWLTIPTKIADLGNLYIKPEYRGQGIGKELMNQAMDWLRQTQDTPYLFVYVSNGNDVSKFYESYGFKYSHDVFGGLITAYIQNHQN